MDFKKANKYIERMIFDGEIYNYYGRTQEKYKDMVGYFSEYFDTSRMNCSDVYNFLYNKEDETHRIYRSNLLEKLSSEGATYIAEYMSKFDENNGQSLMERDFNSTDARQFFRTMVKAMLWLSFFNRRSNNQITTVEDDFVLIDKYKANKKGNLYFRGQSDFSWQLKPSLLRGFNCSELDGCVIDNNKLFEIYDKTNLIKKYNDNISDKIIRSGSDIDYDFLSFMQHAVSYSPLIDFTSDIEVAYKFALNKNNPNTYLQKDSSIFVLEMEKSNNNNDVSDFNIKYLEKKIKPGSIMHIIDSFGKDQSLDFTTITKIRTLLTPKFKIFDRKTNDRMKYQKGKFVLFYDYVSVRGNVYYMLNNQMILFKHKILASQKDSILSSIGPDLNNSYLMNPYQIFND